MKFYCTFVVFILSLLRVNSKPFKYGNKQQKKNAKIKTSKGNKKGESSPSTPSTPPPSTPPVSSPTNNVPTAPYRMGTLLSQPHKLEYERRTMCIGGVKLYGCSDAASQENGGNHIHEIIKGRRHVMHTGAYVAKSACEYSDEVLKGAPPDMNAAESRYQANASIDKKCQRARAAGDSTVAMKDPNEDFEFDSIVVELGIKYKKFVSVVATKMKTPEEKRGLHLVSTGLVPDTTVYLEDMNDKPYMLQGYNGAQLLHEHKITKFEPLTTEDKQMGVKEILRAFAGEGSTQHVVIKDSSMAGIALDLILPPDCDKMDNPPMCLTMKEEISLYESKFDIDFSLNAGEASCKLTGGLTTELFPDPELKMAYANAQGCVTEGIKGTADLDIQFCIDGNFEYDAAVDGSSIPSKNDYEVDMTFSASASVFGVGLDLSVEGKFEMTTESVNDKTYFIGYSGDVEQSNSIGVAHIDFTVGVKYLTSDYKTSNQPDGWATEFYGVIDWGYDILWWHHHAKYTHIFSCHPRSNPICDNFSHPGPPAAFPGNFLGQEQILNYNTNLKSSDGKYEITMQPDGNLVLYAPGHRAVWSSGTSDRKAKEAVMQTDGNFVIYDFQHNAIWSTGTEGKGGVMLKMQVDGNLVIYDKEGNAKWSTGTEK